MTYALLIDDEIDLLESIRSTAELADLTLLTAETWERGLALYQVHSPSLVIADYNLPGSRHGLQLLAEIRRLSPSVRLVLLSAYIGQEDVAEIEGLGLVDRAMPKAAATGTTDEILREIKAARDRANKPTDWASFGRAHSDAQAVSQELLDELDDRLRSNRGIS